MEREKLQDNTRRVGTDYSGAVTLVIDAPPTCPGGGGCVPASRVEMLLNYMAARTGGKVNKFDETTIMGISCNWTPPPLSHLESQEISIKSSAVFHPMAETEVSTVKLQPGSSSWGSHWYSNIQCDWGSLGINPSHFLLFLQLRNKDISLLLTAISAKHINQPQSSTGRQKLQLNKSFIKTTRECVTKSGYHYCRYSSMN